MTKKKSFLASSPPSGYAINNKGEIILENTLKGYGRADYHMHSSIGDAVMTPEDIVDYCEHETSLDVIAITDHDQIKGAVRAREYAESKKCRVQVIVGEEISTLKGHLIGLFMTKRIRRYTRLFKTIEEIHNQGGVTIVPHPLSWLTTSVGEGAFKDVLKSGKPHIFFDAVELINPAIAGRITDDKAAKINKEYWQLPVTGGSDSHSLETIGSAYTLFPGKTAEDFRKGVINGTTLFGGSYWTFNDHWKLFIKKLKKFKVF
jgi:predicted metal-dependent phosphoesterase TrpH